MNDSPTKTVFVYSDEPPLPKVMQDRMLIEIEESRRQASADRADYAAGRAGAGAGAGGRRAARLDPAAIYAERNRQIHANPVVTAKRPARLDPAAIYAERARRCHAGINGAKGDTSDHE